MSCTVYRFQNLIDPWRLDASPLFCRDNGDNNNDALWCKKGSPRVVVPPAVALSVGRGLGPAATAFVPHLGRTRAAALQRRVLVGEHRKIELGVVLVALRYGRFSCSLARYEADWAVFAFRRAMDTLYASVAAAAPVWDAGGAWVGAPAAAVLAAYYSVLAPQRASQRACLEMMQPSVRSLERGC